MFLNSYIYENTHVCYLQKGSLKEKDEPYHLVPFFCGGTGTPYVALASLNYVDPPAFGSQVLGLKVSATTSGNVAPV